MRVRYNVGQLKTLQEIVITTDNNMANIMNNYLSSVFTIEQLNNVPQLRQYIYFFQRVTFINNNEILKAHR